jgi:hypothetical protein
MRPSEQSYIPTYMNDSASSLTISDVPFLERVFTVRLLFSRIGVIVEYINLEHQDLPMQPYTDLTMYEAESIVYKLWLRLAVFSSRLILGLRYLSALPSHRRFCRLLMYSLHSLTICTALDSSFRM